MVSIGMWNRMKWGLERQKEGHSKANGLWAKPELIKIKKKKTTTVQGVPAVAKWV